MFHKGIPAVLVLLLGAVTVAAASSSDAVAPTTVPSPLAPAPRAAAQRHFVLAPTGNEARYRVREQLAGVDFPNDAVGVTSGMTGAITVDSAGRIVAGESKFVVDVTKLKSDRDRRDGYVQRRTLETEKFPTVELVPTSVRGLPASLPASGTATFDLVGNLTVRGVTRPTTWRVSAKFGAAGISGTASTGFTFEDFEMAKPRVASVLSVADSIHLEYDFKLIPAPGTSKGS
ncbi:MAG TPA: YceI family protein [Gemmatimonadaceae bacterium]|jgi:Uncharacterized conserved protein